MRGTINQSHLYDDEQNLVPALSS